MIQILHIPGLQYRGESREQAEERDRRTIEANRRLLEEWKEGERQRAAPMRSMQKWAEERGINRHNETMKSAEKFHRLQAHPHLQAEAIADHYSKLASMSMDLHKLVDMRRRYGGSPETDRCIERLAKEFVDHHREDFGIELSWQNAKAMASPPQTAKNDEQSRD